MDRVAQVAQTSEADTKYLLDLIDEIEARLERIEMNKGWGN
jgi:hypothetical protein